MMNNRKLLKLISLFILYVSSADFLSSMDLDNNLKLDQVNPTHKVEIQIFVEDIPTKMSQKRFEDSYYTENIIPSVPEASKFYPDLKSFIDELPYNSSLWIVFETEEKKYDPMWGEVLNLDGEKTLQYYK